MGAIISFLGIHTKCTQYYRYDPYHQVKEVDMKNVLPHFAFLF